MLNKLIYNFQIALDAILQNKLRGFLTSLGIIFGVASVITMLAIGRGAQEEVMEQMKILGSNNIIVKPELKSSDDAADESETGAKEKKKYTPGLTLADVKMVLDFPHVEAANPEIILEMSAMRKGFRKKAKLVGIGEDFFKVHSQASPA